MTRVIDRFINEGWVNESPSGTVNGSNTAFTLSFIPDDSNGLRLELDGLGLIPSTHYSISGTSITMVTAPALGQKLFARYTKSL